MVRLYLFRGFAVAAALLNARRVAICANYNGAQRYVVAAAVCDACSGESQFIELSGPHNARVTGAGHNAITKQHTIDAILLQLLAPEWLQLLAWMQKKGKGSWTPPQLYLSHSPFTPF